MKRRILALFVALLLTPVGLAVAAPQPTHENISYGKQDRMVMDLWLAETNNPTPLIIWWHGGGFTAGDKNSARHGMFIQAALDKGISVATCNYPYLVGRNYGQCLKNTEDALKFVFKKAKEWNVDTTKVGLSGISAGCLISEYLMCKEKKITAVGVFEQPMGTDTLVMPAMSRCVNPIFLVQASAETDKVHDPKYARMLKAYVDKKKGIIELYGTQKNKIEPKMDEGRKMQFMVAFFERVWSEKTWTKKQWDAARPKLEH
jgi:acetyl esterase/lipase